MVMMGGGPAYYLGPKLTSVFVEALLTGVMFNQLVTFSHRAEREPMIVLVLVGVVTVFALFQTAIAFYAIWNACISNFGHWVKTIAFTWCEKAQTLITICLAVPVQAFLIRRCWILLNRRWYVLAPFVMLLLASIISNIITATQAFLFPNSWLYAPLTKPLKILFTCTFIISQGSSAVLDVGVTGILLTYLARSKPSVVSSRFRRVMKRLTILIWEAAIPPCVCAIITVFFCPALPQFGGEYWGFAFRTILGKLYVVSLFVTLNGRAGLVELPGNLPVVACQCQCHAQSRYNVSAPLTPSAHIRLDISRDPAPSTPDDRSPNTAE